jgi:hypothetical protein
MYDDVISRLQSLGYTPQDGDGWLINFAIDKAQWTIKNYCNITEIPNGLYKICVDMACGEFLLNKKNSGQLTGFSVNLSETPLKSLQEGDTNVSFATEGINSADSQYTALIDWLLNYGKDQFVTYRRIKW